MAQVQTMARAQLVRLVALVSTLVRAVAQVLPGALALLAGRALLRISI